MDRKSVPVQTIPSTTVRQRSRQRQALDTHLELLHRHWGGDFRHMRLEIHIEPLNVDGHPHAPILSSNLLRGGWF